MSSLKESIKRSLVIQEDQSRQVTEDAFHKMLVSKGFTRQGSRSGGGRWADITHVYSHPSGVRVNLKTNSNSKKFGLSNEKSYSGNLEWPGGWSSHSSYNSPDDLSRHIDQKVKDLSADAPKMRFKPKQ